MGEGPRECGVDEMSFPYVLINRASWAWWPRDRVIFQLCPLFTRPSTPGPSPQGRTRGPEAPLAAAQVWPGLESPPAGASSGSLIRSSGKYL